MQYTTRDGRPLTVAEVYRFMGHRDKCRLHSNWSFLRSDSCTCDFDSMWLTLHPLLDAVLDPDAPTRFMGFDVVVNLEQDDRCVLRTSQKLNAEQREAIRAAWQKFAPSIPLVVLDSGLSLEVLRRVEDASRGKASLVTGGIG